MARQYCPVQPEIEALRVWLYRAHHSPRPDSSIAVKRNQTMTEKEQWGEVEVWSFAVRAGV